jgi:hypothetical protein
VPESRPTEVAERLHPGVLARTGGVGIVLLLAGREADARMAYELGPDYLDWLLMVCVGLVADAVASAAVYRRFFRVRRGVWLLCAAVAAGAFVALLVGPTATVVAVACRVDLTSLGYVLAIVGGAAPVALVASRLERGS